MALLLFLVLLRCLLCGAFSYAKHSSQIGQSVQCEWSSFSNADEVAWLEFGTEDEDTAEVVCWMSIFISRKRFVFPSALYRFAKPKLDFFWFHCITAAFDLRKKHVSLCIHIQLSSTADVHGIFIYILMFIWSFPFVRISAKVFPDAACLGSVFFLRTDSGSCADVYTLSFRSHAGIENCISEFPSILPPAACVISGPSSHGSWIFAERHCTFPQQTDARHTQKVFTGKQRIMSLPGQKAHLDLYCTEKAQKCQSSLLSWLHKRVELWMSVELSDKVVLLALVSVCISTHDPSNTLTSSMAKSPWYPRSSIASNTTWK